MTGGSDGAGVVALAALHHLALPHLVFDPLERLVSLNKAAERLLPGLQSSLSTISDVFALPAPAPDPGRDHADGLQQGAAPPNIRFLDALADRSPAWGAQEEAVLDVLPSTGGGGGPSTAVQTVAVAVSRFIPPGQKAAPGRDHLYSVVLVRPVVDRQDRQGSPNTVGERRGSAAAAAPFLRRAESDPPADHTPTLRSTTFADPFNKSSIARRRASEVAASGVRAVRPPIPPTSSSSGSDSTQTIAQRRMSSVSTVSTVTASSEAPHLAHSAVAAANAAESPTSTRGSGSAGGSSSGQRSVGTGSAYSSTSTAATTPPSSSRSASISKSAPPPPVPEVPEDYRGIGVSVSSAGIQLTHSVEARNGGGLNSPLRTTGPATTDWSPKLALANLDPDVTPIGSVAGPPPQTSRPSSVARASSSLSIRGADDDFASSSSTSVADSCTTSTSAHPLPPQPPPPPPPLHSPRPTALPPLPEQKPRIKPDPASLLRFAALANLPHTGVIVSDPDLSSGYANALARELLMGVPSTDGLSKVDDSETGDERSAFEWWENGCWDASEEPWSSASAGTQGSSSTSASQPFFSPMSEMRHNPLDAREIIAAGNASAVERGKGTVGSSLRISKPSDSSRHRMNISGILARTLVSEEKRKAALGRDVPGVGAEEQQGSRFSTAGGASHLPNYSSSIASGLTSPASTTSRSSSNVSRQTPQFVSAGGVSNRKSYRVFDATFSQRTIDPFGPMLEMVARKGEMPPSVGASDDDEEDDDEFSSGGRVMNGMLVGVEIEVWSAGTQDVDSPGAATAHTSSALKAASFVAANPFANRKKRVRRRVLEVTAAPLRAPAADGTMQHLGGILLLRDRTDARKREEAAQSSHRKRGKQNSPSYHKQILDNLPQMVWTTSPLGSHTYYNQTWYTYTGLEPEDSLGVGWQSPFHPDDMDSCLKAWSHSLETGEPYSVEYRCRRFDGEWRWFLGRALPFRDPDGTIKGWSGTCTDFEDLYRQNAAVVQGAGCLLIATDCDGRITFFEGAQKEAVLAEANLSGSIEGRFLSELDSAPDLLRALNRVVSGDTPSAEVAWGRGDRSFRCSLTPLTESRNNSPVIVGCIIVAHDITDLVSIQARLKQSRDKASQLEAAEVAAKEASRLKSEFLALTSHELRTPIAHMLGLSELLLAEELSESQRALVTQLLRSGDVLLELVGQVLDMGKVEAGKLDLEIRPFSLNELSTDVGLYAMTATKKGLQFEEDVDKFDRPVMGDMPRLRQVLVNLLGNAIKFTPRGTITLRIKRVEEDETGVLVRWQVADTGIGIPKETIPALFQPFQRFGGTGLGLSISKRLIELMGGRIQLESEYGVGTTMTVEVRLDKVSNQALAASTSSSPASADMLKKEDVQILVVDDNELNRSICTRLLSKAGFSVESVGNGYEALEALERKRFDLVLMDNQMEGLDGLQTTIRIRQSNNPQVAHVKIIALTASALKGDRDAFLASGADGYLSKPVRAAVLESTILRTLSPHIAPSAAASLGLSGTALVGTPPVDTASRGSYDFGGDVNGQRETGAASYP
ncbi:hypothetical protein C6P46_005527 [Rhodotorula mucilaginosa]|uniref:Histidine kinase n=1 Tax=Rhodotorula mucilaginosa TaxID=5537 RepID=A0A9P6VYW1_RHOMI|nr:hypothetical protein C6P46_005527 [Rhodotorula mucilaginosa]